MCDARRLRSKITILCSVRLHSSSRITEVDGEQNNIIIIIIYVSIIVYVYNYHVYVYSILCTMMVMAAACRGKNVRYAYRLGLTPSQLRSFVLTLHGGGDGKRI